jgi:hypothetical protein
LKLDFGEIDTYEFFKEDFLKNIAYKVKKLDKSNMVEITTKAFRYFTIKIIITLSYLYAWLVMKFLSE